jgi:hypothetical protein
MQTDLEMLIGLIKGIRRASRKEILGEQLSRGLFAYKAGYISRCRIRSFLVCYALSAKLMVAPAVIFGSSAITLSLLSNEGF